jgi:hypothetical protein
MADCFRSGTTESAGPPAGPPLEGTDMRSPCRVGRSRDASSTATTANVMLMPRDEPFLAALATGA